MNVKNYFLILISFLFLSTNQNFAQSSNIYTVFVGNYPNPQRQEFSLLGRYGFIYSVQQNQNMSRVYLGGFEKEKNAKAMVQNIKAMYPNAAVEKRTANPNDEAIVIQVATRVFNQKINWPKYQKLENIFALLSGDKVKIVTGIYPNMEAARNDLKIIRSDGFSDAFLKVISRNMLIDLKAFETGIKEPVIPLNLDNNNNAVAVSNPGKTNVSPTNPALTNTTAKTASPIGYESVIPRNPDFNAAPGSYEQGNPTNPANTVVAGNPTIKGANSTTPKINSKIKRRSALELQKVLKAYGTYTGSLDGYYGPGTTAGYEAIKQQNKDIQKYAVLSQYSDTYGQDSRPLQQAINTLLSEPSAPGVIDGSNEAVAKAYQAYMLFSSLGPSNDVNLAMNTAIRLAYSNPQGSIAAPFDYTATYAYNDWNQLVLHLHFIHGAPNNTYAAPCWLIQRHPQISAEAQSLFARVNSNSYLVQNCDEFMQWEPIRMLKTVSADLNPDNPNKTVSDATLASQRSQLYLTNVPLDKSNQLAYEGWNRDLWTGLNGWASVDPLHKRLVDVLRVAYFQSQVQLEDFFMNKGFNTEQATGLALATIKTVVGNDLERFL